MTRWKVLGLTSAYLFLKWTVLLSVGGWLVRTGHESYVLGFPFLAFTLFALRSWWIRKPTLRRVSSVEKLWLVQAAVGAPFVITFVVEAQGELTNLRQAVAAASEASPAARARLAGALGWLRWVDSGEPPPILPLQSGPTPGPVEGTHLLENGGAGLEVGIAPGPVLVFRVHHALMDGRGLSFFVANVFRYLRGEAMHIGDDTLTDDAITTTTTTTTNVAPLVRFRAPTGLHGGEAGPPKPSWALDVLSSSSRCRRAADAGSTSYPTDRSRRSPGKNSARQATSLEWSPSMARGRGRPPISSEP